MEFSSKRDLERQLSRAWPPASWSDVTTLVAVSGGADSVGLLRALWAIRRAGPGRLVAAHYNHRLRPSADTDADFVRGLCLQLDVELVIETAARPPVARDEATARDERYGFFHAAVRRCGARYLATAHTRDDQIETVLHRVLRGTGINGLAGIPRIRPLTSTCCLIRPLLDIGRSDVREYLDELAQPFREDPTNQDLGFTRNRLRHELLPHLAETYNPRIGEALTRLASLAGECRQLADERVQRLVEQATCATVESVRISVPKLKGESPYVVRQLLMDVWTRQGWPKRDMGFAQWDELADMLLPDSRLAPRRHFPGRILAERQDDHLRLCNDNQESPP